MKRTRGEKERWEDFEARVGIKRSGGGKKETQKAAPNDILVPAQAKIEDFYFPQFFSYHVRKHSYLIEISNL